MMEETLEDINMRNNAAKLASTGQRPLAGDAELAAQYKHDMTLALQAVALIMDRARAVGLTVGWQAIQLTQSGKHEPLGITVARYY